MNQTTSTAGVTASHAGTEASTMTTRRTDKDETTTARSTKASTRPSKRKSLKTHDTEKSLLSSTKKSTKKSSTKKSRKSDSDAGSDRKRGEGSNKSEESGESSKSSTEASGSGNAQETQPEANRTPCYKRIACIRYVRPMGYDSCWGGPGGPYGGYSSYYDPYYCGFPGEFPLSTRALIIPPKHKDLYRPARKEDFYTTDLKTVDVCPSLLKIPVIDDPCCDPCGNIFIKTFTLSPQKPPPTPEEVPTFKEPPPPPPPKPKPKIDKTKIIKKYLQESKKKPQPPPSSAAKKEHPKEHHQPHLEKLKPASPKPKTHHEHHPHKEKSKSPPKEEPKHIHKEHKHEHKEEPKHHPPEKPKSPPKDKPKSPPKEKKHEPPPVAPVPVPLPPPSKRKSSIKNGVGTQDDDHFGNRGDGERESHYHTELKRVGSSFDKVAEKSTLLGSRLDTVGPKTSTVTDTTIYKRLSDLNTTNASTFSHPPSSRSTDMSVLYNQGAFNQQSYSTI